MNKAELKAKLMAEAEAVIEAMLDKGVPNQQMTMRDIVAIVLESGQQLEAAMVATLSQETAEKEPTVPVCEACGRPITIKANEAVTS